MMREILRSGVAVLLASAVLFLNSLPAEAQSAGAQPPRASRSVARNILLQWIDAHGRIYSGGQLQKLEWKWAELKQPDGKKADFKSPVLRLWIKDVISPTWQRKETREVGLDLVEWDLGKQLVVDLRGPESRLRVFFTDKSGKPQEMTLAIFATTNKPFLIVHPECRDLGLSAGSLGSGAHFMTGVYCDTKEDDLEVTLFRSPDSSWDESSARPNASERTGLVIKRVLKKPVSASGTEGPSEQELARYGVLDSKKEASQTWIRFRTMNAKSRFLFTAGTAVTYYDYSEDSRTRELFETAIIGKLGVNTRLGLSNYDLNLSVFATLLPLTHAPADLNPARFLGINGRIGHPLPFKTLGLSYKILAGWYFWSMSVPKNKIQSKDYGINAVSGPQLFLTASHRPPKGRAWWTYTKFALISAGFNVSADNREFAIGGGFDLFTGVSKPLALTLDVANTQFVDPLNSMSVWSYSLGVQRAL